MGIEIVQGHPEVGALATCDDRLAPAPGNDGFYRVRASLEPEYQADVHDGGVEARPALREHLGANS